MQAKIKCEAILSCALTPFPVLTATFKKGPCYLWLDFDYRMALSELWRELNIASPRVPAYPGPFPELLRGHAIDAETGEANLLGRAGVWHGGEDLWVDALYVAPFAVDALLAWRMRQRSDGREGKIAAPNWRVLCAVRALALAGQRSDPGVNWPDTVATKESASVG